jgi:hypothetical protein
MSSLRDVLYQADRAVRTAAVRQLFALQSADGALAMGPADRGSRRLVPYFSNLGAFGVVVTGGIKSERERIRRWVLWYDAHRNPDGTVYDYEGGSGAWKATGKYDSTDSYASTYLELIYALHRADDDKAWLKERYPFVRRAIEAIRLTMQTNGLTTAHPKWPVMYTMDNVEVLRGLRAAVLLAKAMGSGDDAKAWAALGDRTQDAIARYLWDDTKGCYLVGRQTDNAVFAGGLEKWYPDVMANLMAIGWLPKDAPSARHHADLYRRLAAKTADSPSAGIPAIANDDELMGRLAWWGYAARAMRDKERLSKVRAGLIVSLNDEKNVFNNPATLGHACRLLSEKEV